MTDPLDRAMYHAPRMLDGLGHTTVGGEPRRLALQGRAGRPPCRNRRPDAGR